MSVNMPRCLPIETSAACLSCILMRSEPLAFCETSAIAAAASSLILSASTIVTRGITTITGSPSSPFSVRVTSSLRDFGNRGGPPAHDFADVRKAEELELADDLLDRHLGALSPGAHDLRDAGLNPNILTGGLQPHRMIGCGVFAGRKSAYQLGRSKLVSPCSCAEGRSGRFDDRVLLRIAIGLTVLPAICGKNGRHA